MDGPKFGRAGARRQAARIGGWRPKNWKSDDQPRCRERSEFGNDPELEQCGPKIGKAQQPAASGGSRRLEKSVFKYHKYCVEDGLSVDTPERRSGVSFLPTDRRPPLARRSRWPANVPPPRRLPGPPASAGCPRRPLLPAGLSGVPPRRRRPADAPLAAFRDRPPLPVAPPVAPSRRPLGSSSPPTPTRRCPPPRRLPGPPASAGCRAGRSFPLAPGSSSPPPTRRPTGCLVGRRPPLPVVPPAAPSRRPLGSSSPPTPTRRPTGCPVGRRRLCRLPRRSLLPAGLSGVPLRRRRPAASRGHRSRLVAPSGLFFPPAIPIDPPVSPSAGPPPAEGGVCLPFGRNGGRKCRSRLEYCAEFPSFVTPKHQYHEKPPPRTLCVCGLLQCSAGRMLRA